MLSGGNRYAARERLRGEFDWSGVEKQQKNGAYPHVALHDKRNLCWKRMVEVEVMCNAVDHATRVHVRREAGAADHREWRTKTNVQSMQMECGAASVFRYGAKTVLKVHAEEPACSAYLVASIKNSTRPQCELGILSQSRQLRLPNDWGHYSDLCWIPITKGRDGCKDRTGFVDGQLRTGIWNGAMLQ